MSDLLQSEHHPDADQLNAFVEHALPQHEQQQTLAHLAVCAHCRSIVALSLPEMSPVAVARPANYRPHPSRVNLFGPRLAWLAAAAVVLLGIPVYLVQHASDRIGSADLATQRLELRAPSPTDAQKTSPQPKVATAAPVLAEPKPQRAKSTTANGNSSDLPLHGREVAASILPQQPQSGNGSSPGKGVVVLEAGSGDAPEPPQASAPTGSGASTVNVAAQASELAPLSPSASAGIALRTVASLPLQGQLPSGYPVLSSIGIGHDRVALDTRNALYFSSDDGVTWSPVTSQWTGRAIRVDLASRTLPAIGRSSHASMQLFAARVSGGSLGGIITDASGAVIPTATVVVRSQGNSIVRTTTTDATGHYLFNGLAPGSYQVEAAAPGFAQQSSPAIDVATSQEAVSNLSLAVGQSSQTVSVDTLATTPALAAKKLKQPQPLMQPPRFEITTDTGDRWTSIDGKTWKHQ